MSPRTQPTFGAPSPQEEPLAEPEASFVDPVEEDEAAGRLPGSGTARGMRRRDLWSGAPGAAPSPLPAPSPQAVPYESPARATRFGLPSLQRSEAAAAPELPEPLPLPAAEPPRVASTQFGLPALRRDETSISGSLAGGRGPSAPRPVERAVPQVAPGEATLAPGRPFAAFDAASATHRGPIRVEPEASVRRTSLGLSFEVEEDRDAGRRTQFGIPAPRLGEREEFEGEVRPGPKAPRRGEELGPSRSTSAGFQRIDPSLHTGRLTLPVPRLGEPEGSGEAPLRREDSGLFRMPSKQTLEVRAPMVRNTMMGMRAQEAANQRRAASGGRYMLHGTAIEGVEEPAQPQRRTMLHMGALRLDPATGEAIAPPAPVEPASPLKPSPSPSTPAFAIPAPRESGSFGAVDVDGGWGEGSLGELFGDDFDAALQTALEDSLEQPSSSAIAARSEAGAEGLARSAVEGRPPGSGRYRTGPSGQGAPGSGVYATRRPRAAAPAELGLASSSAVGSTDSRSAIQGAGGVPQSGVMRAVRGRAAAAPAAAPAPVPAVLEVTRPASRPPEAAQSVAPGSGIFKGGTRRRRADEPEQEVAPALAQPSRVAASDVWPAEVPRRAAAEPAPAPVEAQAVAPKPTEVKPAPAVPAALPVEPSPAVEAAPAVVARSLEEEPPPQEALAPAEPLAPAEAAPVGERFIRGAALVAGVLALLGPVLIVLAGPERGGGLGVVVGLAPCLVGGVLVALGALRLPARLRAGGVALIGGALSVASLMVATWLLGVSLLDLWMLGVFGVLLPLGLLGYARSGGLVSRVALVAIASVTALLGAAAQVGAVGWVPGVGLGLVLVGSQLALSVGLGALIASLLGRSEVR